jgi:hypothetical protein
MRAVLAALMLFLLTGLVGGTAQAEPLTFAGFHRETDLAALADRYPRASHELTADADVRKLTSQDDPKEWMRDFFRNRGSGTYVVRLTPDESHDNLYYVQAWIRQGTTERLWLLLEKPLDTVRGRRSIGSNEARHPACYDVLKPLTAKYGQPDALAPRWEEALEFFDYVWARLPDSMTLECGRYQGRKAVFAIQVTFEEAAAR